MRLQSSPTTSSTTTGVIALPAKDVEGALAVLDDVAAENGFRAEPLSSNAAQSGWLRDFSRTYAPYPKKDMYRHVSLKAQLKQNEEVFEIIIFEFFASRESDFGRQLRLLLESRLKQRFPDARITSRS